MDLSYKYPHECIRELERRLSHEPMTFTGRKGAGPQVQCQACKRWKYADERCNLFTTTRQVSASEKRE